MSKQELYRQLILKHYKNPANIGLEKNNPHAYLSQQKNFSCGDEITLQVTLEKNKIVNIRYELQGCSILVASASLMSIHLKNNTLEESIEQINNFLNLLENKPFDKKVLKEELHILENVIHFSGKFKCASMPWVLLLKMIQKRKNTLLAPK
ncbi:MAG: iron-sulfur cluster assembly scaffold protein [Candidatus Phytoplasma pruni]|uniref:Fe-S cluster assembly sulfur transfer protein SufU n=1 Tax=Poinsettia branch-inducing phytoplasma TaxID=138647 RepID=UPI000368315F|nr:SUF system NifU family Fe-S cluster assembly protein [Poinsettia branch-inducing phytoplasma]WEK82632.1 MAG: iron-sulfur cluster assembly scaffold protein [Candidatus Phytoplasma pruni]